MLPLHILWARSCCPTPLYGLKSALLAFYLSPHPHSSHLMQIIQGTVCPPPKGYIAIVVARFNRTITNRLLEGALAKLRQHQVRDNDIKVAWVPGAYEIPFIASYFARDADCLAVICLGAVIKGETSHDQHINRAVSTSLNEIASRFGTPVIFGVLTCDTVEQANARSGGEQQSRDKAADPTVGNKGAEAAEAALEMIDLMTELPAIQVPRLPPIPQIISKMFGQGNDDDDDDNDFDDFGDYDDFFDDDDDDGGTLQFRPSKKVVKKAKKKTPKKKS